MRPLVAAAALCALAAVSAGCGDGVSIGAGATQSGPDLTAVQTMVSTAPAPPPAPAPARVAAAPGYLTAYVTRSTFLLSGPGARPVARLPRLTEFGSPRVLAVVRRRGPWLGVVAAELRNGKLGWIDSRANVRLFRNQWSMVADLSRRTLTVRRNGRVVVRTLVAIGSPAAPTPRGRFAVTDRLTTGNPGGPYGCCVLALTAHQPSLPQGWGGGDRIAIHATPAEQTIGQAASHGCLRAPNAVMRRLIREVPLGTPVRIQA